MPPVLSLLLLVLSAGAASSAPSAAWPHYELAPDAAWSLNLPDFEPFGASGLLRLPDGSLVTVSDRGSEIYRIERPPGTNAAHLVLVTNLFPDWALTRLTREKRGHLDCEGLGIDDRGRVYLCEESERWILRCDPRDASVERLVIDWAPVQRYFSPRDRNASFEGLAVGGGKLYLANERDQGRIIEVDLASRKVVGDFEVRTSRQGLWDNHYSDLSWHQGRLYVLCRESRAVLEVDPARHEVVAEYSYTAIEANPEYRFRLRVPLVGVMEGLAVDDAAFWLVTDNNDLPRERHPEDRRPLLFHCPRPKR